MAGELLTSAVVGAGLVALAFAAVELGRGWYGYDPTYGETAERSLLANPVVWFLGFVVLAVGAVAGVLLLFTGDGPGGLGMPVLLGVAGLVGLYLVGGVYLVARQRGHSNAMAVGEAVTTAGVVFLLGIVAQLVA